MEPRQEHYLQHLATLGVNLASVRCDERGTVRQSFTSSQITKVVDSAPPVVRLPVLRTEDTPHAAADVRMRSLLGEGGMGRVLEAEQVALRRSVAVKTSRSPSDGMPVELLREALVAARLEHPNIVPVYLLGTSPEGAALFVMRRVDGVPWSEVLRQPDSEQSRALMAGVSDPVEWHLEVFSKVCDAVQFAHARGVLHRDLKPDNVMLGYCGEVYVVDWGIAVALREDVMLPSARESTGIAGSPAYMAPEMASARGEDLSERTDVYLLGATLCEVLTGKPPHAGGTLPEMLVHAFEGELPEFGPAVPDEVAAVLRKALAARPEDRYARVEELRRAVLDLRRHRGAHRLLREAEGLLRALLERLSARVSVVDGAGPGDDSALQESFVECRFAFRQVLAEWGDSEAARKGLRALLEAQCAHELARGNPRSARSVLSQLSDPPPALTERVRGALAEENEKAARASAFEAMRRDADVDQGLGMRAQVVLVTGVLWSLAAFSTGHLHRTGILRFGYREALIAAAFYGLTATVAFEAFRRRANLNEAQRRLLRATWFVTASIVAVFPLGYISRTPIESTVSFMAFVAGVQWIVSAVLFDRRLGYSGLSLAVGSFLMAVFPAARFEVLGLSMMTAFVFLYRAWTKADRRARAEGAGAPRP